ncbi:hypothetical protein Drorol1_Dr00024755 [Drosera rotundifolia]
MICLRCYFSSPWSMASRRYANRRWSGGVGVQRTFGESGGVWGRQQQTTQQHQKSERESEDPKIRKYSSNSVMVREVTGVRVEHKSSLIKTKPNGASHVADHDTSSSIPAVTTESKDQVNGDEKHDEKSVTLEDQNPNSPHKPAMVPDNVENGKTEHSVQEHMDHENENHACVSPVVAKDPVSDDCSLNGATSPTSENKSQSNSSFVPKKLSDEDDNWSLSSSTAGSTKTNRSKVTVAVAPTFKVDERLEKRKEFYSKLEEKHRALEAEKRDYEARTKEEEEAAIKQLRKSMVVRANPVPSFYYEPPPPKKELKKLPTTRAKSPNIGRRKSSSDVVKSSPEQDNAACSRALRHSLGNRNKDSYTPTGTPKKKDHSRQQSANGSRKVKERQNQAKEVSQSMTEEMTTDIAVGS